MSYDYIESSIDLRVMYVHDQSSYSDISESLKCETSLAEEFWFLALFGSLVGASTLAIVELPSIMACYFGPSGVRSWMSYVSLRG